MSGNNNYLSGKQNTTLAPVRGNIKVDAGDLMFIHNTDGALGATPWAADNLAYPFTSLACTAANAVEAIIAKAFLGVALESSESGVTENITVATSGVFRFINNPLGGVTVGVIASACTQPSIGCSNQAVTIDNILAPGSTGYLGYVVKASSSGATYVDVRIQTVFGPDGVVPQ